MSNTVIIDALLILSSVILIAELILISWEIEDDHHLNGQAQAQVMIVATVGLVSSLVGMWLRQFMDSKRKNSVRCYTLVALLYVVFIVTGILLSFAFMMVNWTIVTRTGHMTTHFLGASMLSSAYLIAFSLAILNFLFNDFLHVQEDDDLPPTYSQAIITV